MRLQQFTLDDVKQYWDMQEQLENLTAFSCDGLTYRKETRYNESYWYAYKKINRKVYKFYVGKRWDLRHDRMQQVKLDLIDKANGIVKPPPPPKPPINDIQEWFDKWANGTSFDHSVNTC